MGSISGGDEMKPHAVFVPYPSQGHVTPLLHLAKLVHSRGFHITFVNTHYNHRRLLKSGALSVDGIDALPDFVFESVSDGLPPSEAEEATQDIPALCESLSKNFVPGLTELLHKLSGGPPSCVPPVTWIVADLINPFTVDAGKAVGIPVAWVWPSSACCLMACLHFQHLIDRGLVPLKNEEDASNGYLNMEIDSIPGLRNMRLKDLTTFIRTTNPDDVMLNYFITMSSKVRSGSIVMMNTFEELDRELLQALKPMLPPIYTIGPIHLLAKQLPSSSLVAPFGSNLWREERGCFAWLEQRPPRSVLYVNFGSIAVMSNEEMMEFAWCLANSHCCFLWVLRGDLVMGSTAVLPKKFLEETKDRGFLSCWCPQEEVLSHPSIGGFLTHNGWNSTIESISHGVPMISWPFFADQQTNCRYACTVWGVCMEIGDDVKRDKIEGLVRELMGGSKGREMSIRASQWKDCADRAISPPRGTSFHNFQAVVENVLLQKPKFLQVDE